MKKKCPVCGCDMGEWIRGVWVCNNMCCGHQIHEKKTVRQRVTHKDNGEGKPLCGMVSGVGNDLDVAKTNGLVNCSRCQKKLARETVCRDSIRKAYGSGVR